MRLVLCNGCFDLLHPGHLSHLREARAMGDSLVVALTLDEDVGKKGRPIWSWGQRAAMLLELRCVDDVSACHEPVTAILSWKPSIYVKGADYSSIGLTQAEIAACESIGAQIRFTKSPKESTTNLIERIKNG